MVNGLLFHFSRVFENDSKLNKLYLSLFLLLLESEPIFRQFNRAALLLLLFFF